MECYFVSYSRERSIKYWNEHKATSLTKQDYPENEPGFWDDVMVLEYEVDNLVVAEELQQLFPEIKETLTSVPFNPEWGRPFPIAEALYSDTPNLNETTPPSRDGVSCKTHES